MEGETERRPFRASSREMGSYPGGMLSEHWESKGDSPIGERGPAPG